MKPDAFNMQIKIAAEKTLYPQCLMYIEGNMHKDFHSMANATLMYYLPRNILNLKTKQERKKAIDSIPEDVEPAHFKQFVINGVRSLWDKDRRAKANG